MGIVCSLGIIFCTLLAPLSGQAEPMEEDSTLMVERINQRYDDFFRRQRQLEEIDQQREREAGLVKIQRQKERDENERARQEYVKSRKKTVVDPQLEQAWLEQEKAWIEINKLAGRRYSQKRQYLEDIERKGRQIPGKVEYEIED